LEESSCGFGLAQTYVLQRLNLEQFKRTDRFKAISDSNNQNGRHGVRNFYRVTRQLTEEICFQGKYIKCCLSLV